MHSPLVAVTFKEKASNTYYFGGKAMSAVSKFLRAAGIAGLVAAGGLADTPAKAERITFIPGTYDLAETNLGPPIDTLVVSISGGIADFTLSGANTATFAVQNNSTPTGDVSGVPGIPYYSVASIVSASWSASDYPYLVFWPTRHDGGFTVGTYPGAAGTNLFNLFQSTEGAGQVFTVTVPEPSTWALMLVGFAALGLAVRRNSTRGRSSAVAA
jgi:hypothetical protein